MKIENENTVIGISGMTCEECVKKVRDALNAVDGVRVQSVQIGSAVVQCEGQEACALACKAIEDAGYSALKNSTPAAKSPEKEKESVKQNLASQDMVSEGGGSAGMAIDAHSAARTPEVEKSQK